jgi:hypothetical protein
MYRSFHAKYRLFWSDFGFSFIKIPPVGAELIHADRRTWRNLTVAFRKFANAPKTVFQHHTIVHMCNMVCLGIEPGLRWWVAVLRPPEIQHDGYSLHWLRSYLLSCFWHSPKLLEIGASQHACFLSKLHSYPVLQGYVSSILQTRYAKHRNWKLLSITAVCYSLTDATPEREVTR